MTTYRLVPVEPSEEMLNAGYTAALPIYRDEGCEPNPNDYRAIWKAMLQAAPVPQNELLEAAKEISAYFPSVLPTKGVIPNDLIVKLRLAIRNAEQAQGTPTP